MNTKQNDNPMNEQHTPTETHNGPISDDAINAFLTDDALYFEAIRLNGDTALSLHDGGDLPPEPARDALRAELRDIAEQLLQATEQPASADKHYTFGRITVDYLNSTESIVDSADDLFRILHIENLTTPECVAYTAFATVYRNADPDEYADVNPFLVHALSEQYTDHTVIQQIVKRFNDHDAAVALGTLNAFTSLETLTPSVETAITHVMREGVDDIPSAVQHLFILTQQDPPTEHEITDHDAFPTHTITDVIIPGGEQTREQPSEPSHGNETGHGTATTGSENQATLTMNTTPDTQSTDETPGDNEHSETYTDGLDEIVTTINKHVTEEDTQLDAAWTLGNIIEKGHDKHGLSFTEMRDAIVTEHDAFDTDTLIAACGLASLYDYDGYPAGTTLNTVHHAVTTFDTAHAARAAIDHCGTAEDDVTDTAVTAWDAVTDFRTRNVLDAVTSTDPACDVIDTVQTVFRFEGIPAPTRDRVNAVRNPADYTNDELDTVLETAYTELENALDGCDLLWATGHLIDEFTTEHGYSYTAIRDVTGISRAKEGAGRDVFNLFAYGEYDDDWTSSVLWKAGIAMDFETDLEEREAFLRCADLDSPLTVSITQIANDVETPSLPTVAEAVADASVSDSVGAVKHVYCLLGRGIPDTYLIETALEAPAAAQNLTPDPYTTSNSADEGEDVIGVARAAPHITSETGDAFEPLTTIAAEHRAVPGAHPTDNTTEEAATSADAGNETGMKPASEPEPATAPRTSADEQPATAVESETAETARTTDSPTNAGDTSTEGEATVTAPTSTAHDANNTEHEPGTEDKDEHESESGDVQHGAEEGSSDERASELAAANVEAEHPYIEAIQNTTSVSVDLERATLTADTDTVRELCRAYSAVIPNAAITNYLTNFDELTTLVTGTGMWSQLLTDAGVTITAVNPAPPYFDAPEHYTDVQETTLYNLPNVIDADTPLVIADPAFDGDVVTSAIQAYHDAGGDTIIYLGAFPGTPSILEHTTEPGTGMTGFMTELTRGYVYVTSIDGMQWQHTGAALHVFTRDGTNPVEKTQPDTSNTESDEPVTGNGGDA